ncbi:MAG TPA: Crp/Fnr family transcriptional regulator [Solirubrobacteraceae bacterium]|nr:Crp/Fnr family transcriptional regulator [Solirubrobacteraceae bacterium]
MPSCVSILEYDPELAEDLSDDDLAIARPQLVADVRRYARGTWTFDPDDFDHVANLGLLIVKGLLARRVTVGDHTSAELLGPGDVLQPWLLIDADQSVAVQVGWEVLQPVQAAMLHRRFCALADKWPEIKAAISRRIVRRAHRLAFQLAICNLRPLDDRLLLVLWQLADRLGKVTPEGVLLDFPLTHDLLAAMVGARRPSVSVAVGRLTDQGQVRPRPRSRWLLLEQPPAELQERHERESGSRGSSSKETADA